MDKNEANKGEAQHITEKGGNGNKEAHGDTITKGEYVAWKNKQQRWKHKSAIWRVKEGRVGVNKTSQLVVLRGANIAPKCGTTQY